MQGFIFAAIIAAGKCNLMKDSGISFGVLRV